MPGSVQTGSGPRSHKTHGDSRLPDQVLPPAPEEASTESNPSLQSQTSSTSRKKPRPDLAPGDSP